MSMSKRLVFAAACLLDEGTLKVRPMGRPIFEPPKGKSVPIGE